MHRPRLARHAGVALLATLGLSAVATPAHAATPPVWGVTIADLAPRNAAEAADRIDYVAFNQTGGSLLPPAARVVLRVERAGVVIGADAVPSRFGAEADLRSLEAGDVATLFDQSTGAVYATVTFDGRPSFDPSTCAGSAAFSGQRSAGSLLVELRAFRWTKTNPSDGYGAFGNWSRTELDPGKVGTITGDGFSGQFRRPLTAGMTLTATSTNELSDTLTVAQTVERTVGACPPAPPVVAPGPPPVLLRDTVAPLATVKRPSSKRLAKLTIKKLLSSGLTLGLTSTEAGTARATLFLVAKPGKKPVALSRASARVVIGQAAAVTLALPKRAKKKLKGLSSKARLLARITVTDAAGNVSTPKDLTFKIPRA